MRTNVYLVGLAALLGVAAATRASDPTGVYARVDKVVLEPSDAKPERIQIWGAFALAKGRGGDDYQPPAAGYLYYSLDDKKPDLCRKAWEDLKKAAGTGQCVAFGSRYRPLGTVRKADQKPKDPEPFPLAMGVIKVDASNPQAQLLKRSTRP